MGRKALLISGALLMAGALSVFALNTYGQSWTYVLMGALTLIFSVLDGRKIAGLVHDSHALKLRTGRLFSISGMIAIVMFFFILFVLFATITMMLVFKVAGMVASVYGAGLTTFLYAILALVCSYILFRYSYDAEPYELRSSWGKRMEKAHSIPLKMKEKGISAVKKTLETAGGERGFIYFPNLLCLLW